MVGIPSTERPMACHWPSPGFGLATNGVMAAGAGRWAGPLGTGRVGWRSPVFGWRRRRLAALGRGVPRVPGVLRPGNDPPPPWLRTHSVRRLPTVGPRAGSVAADSENQSGERAPGSQGRRCSSDGGPPRSTAPAASASAGPGARGGPAWPGRGRGAGARRLTPPSGWSRPTAGRSRAGPGRPGPSTVGALGGRGGLGGLGGPGRIGAGRSLRAPGPPRAGAARAGAAPQTTSRPDRR